MAIPIIGAAAKFEDEINAQMDTGVVSPVAVNTVGATAKRSEREAARGAGTGVETCKICDKPGHNARDCLLFMQLEGTCGHWFMHSIGKYRTGCTYGHACKNKHERPSTEPADNMIPVSINATATIPHTNGGQQVLIKVHQHDVKDKKFTILPNNTESWMNSNKIWMEP